MRFGGFIFKKWNTPEEWAQAALEGRCEAVFLARPVSAEEAAL